LTRLERQARISPRDEWPAPTGAVGQSPRARLVSPAPASRILGGAQGGAARNLCTVTEIPQRGSPILSRIVDRAVAVTHDLSKLEVGRLAPHGGAFGFPDRLGIGACVDRKALAIVTGGCGVAVHHVVGHRGSRAYAEHIGAESFIRRSRRTRRGTGAHPDS